MTDCEVRKQVCLRSSPPCRSNELEALKNASCKSEVKMDVLKAAISLLQTELANLMEKGADRDNKQSTPIEFLVVLFSCFLLMTIHVSSLLLLELCSSNLRHVFAGFAFTQTKKSAEVDDTTADTTESLASVSPTVSFQ